MTKITDEMVERVARRMCVANGDDPDGFGLECGALENLYHWQGRARDAIAARIALDEIMPPDRATLLAAADAAATSSKNLSDRALRYQDAGAEHEANTCWAASEANAELAAVLRAKVSEQS